MNHLIDYQPPNLESPILIFAFSGWADAAESATHALQYLIDQCGASKFAEIDAEEFYDFTQVRPTIDFDLSQQRVISWPANQFFAHKGRDGSSDLVMLLGTEPSLRWRTFCKVICDLAQELSVKRVVQLGALLDAVPHTRDPKLSGTSSIADLRNELEGINVRRSQYVGPTGVSSVVADAFRQQAIPYLSVWGHAPHYLQGSPNPNVSCKILEVVGRLLDLPLDLTQLRSEGSEFERRVAEMMEQEPQIVEYVRKLELYYDDRLEVRDGSTVEMPEPEEAVHDLEEFLKQQRQEMGPEGNS